MQLDTDQLSWHTFEVSKPQTESQLNSTSVAMIPTTIQYQKTLAWQMVHFSFLHDMVCTSKVSGLLMDTKGLWNVYLQQQQRQQKQLQRLHTSIGGSQLEMAEFIELHDGSSLVDPYHQAS